MLITNLPLALNFLCNICIMAIIVFFCSASLRFFRKNNMVPSHVDAPENALRFP